MRELAYHAFPPQRFKLLKQPADISPESLHEVDLKLRYTKQRTEEWLAAREDGSLSSSQIGVAMNYFGDMSRAIALQDKIWKQVSYIF